MELSLSLSQFNNNIMVHGSLIVDKFLTMRAQLYDIVHMAAIHIMCTYRINICVMEKSG